MSIYVLYGDAYTYLNVGIIGFFFIIFCTNAKVILYICRQEKYTMDKYKIISANNKGLFSERLACLYMTVGDFVDMEKLYGRNLQYCKVFLSDAQNQYHALIESELYIDIVSKVPHTIVEQAPLDGSKISILMKTSEKEGSFIFNSIRLKAEESTGIDAYTQTRLLFDKYLKSIEGSGMTINKNCVRTWIYVNDIDNNYADVVKARNDIFDKFGLTSDTHYIASTGIGGRSQIRDASVAMDFLTYPEIKETDKKYLQALDHLNPTHEYGVAFERGVRIDTGNTQTFFISGTASIDKNGMVMYKGDVIRQTGRLLENIGALLKDGGATMKDIKYFIIYLRDISDYQSVSMFMNNVYKDIPFIIVEAKVCRPEWLIEMECVASKTI